MLEKSKVASASPQKIEKPWKNPSCGALSCSPSLTLRLHDITLCHSMSQQFRHSDALCQFIGLGHRSKFHGLAKKAQTYSKGSGTGKNDAIVTAFIARLASVYEFV